MKDETLFARREPDSSLMMASIIGYRPLFNTDVSTLTLSPTLEFFAKLLKIKNKKIKQYSIEHFKNAFKIKTPI